MKRIVTVLALVALLVLLSAQSTWAKPQPAGPIVHVVRWGENLISIARRYGVTVHAIASANGIVNTNRIYAGQRLVIPGTAPAPAPVGGCIYVVRPGDNLTSIAYRRGVTIYAIVRRNGIVNPNRIYVGQRLRMPCASPPAPAPPTPAPGGAYYVVRAGDTLAKIALRFGVSVWSIVQANSIPNPNLIHVGQRLFIPKGVPPPPPGPVKPGCEHLKWPKQGAVLSGVIGAWGTADHVNFDYYKIEVRRDGLDEWHYVTGQSKPVHDGPLGAWDTRTMSDGPYTFRLVVVDKTGNYPPPCEIAVRVRNHP